MPTQTQNIPRWFKSQPQKLQSSKIDKEDGIIYDVVMCQAGPAKGHGLHLEAEFIADLIAYDNKHFSKNGLKCRFGHPSMSDTTMGSQMGVFKNFRQSGDKAIADLHLLDAANISPTRPNMKDWMLEMAEENPEFVMMSIVFTAGGYYQRDATGKKHYCWYYEESEDEDGDKTYRWVSPRSKWGDIFAEFGNDGEHFYTDAVEAGAATDSLFSNQFNQDKFGVQASTWLQEHPELLNFLKKNPEKIFQFAESCGIDLPKPKLNFQDKAAALKDWLFGGVKEIEGTEEELESAGRITELEGKVTEWRDQAEMRLGEIERLNAQLETANARITELEAEPAAELTSGPKETQLGPQKGESFLSDPVYLKAKAIQAKHQSK